MRSPGDFSRFYVAFGCAVAKTADGGGVLAPMFQRVVVPGYEVHFEVTRFRTPIFQRVVVH